MFVEKSKNLIKIYGRDKLLLKLNPQIICAEQWMLLWDMLIAVTAV